MRIAPNGAKHTHPTNYIHAYMYQLADVRKGNATVVDTLQHIVRGYVEKDRTTWSVWVPAERHEDRDDNGNTVIRHARKVATGLPTRAAAANFTIWYDSHRKCCTWTSPDGHNSHHYLTTT